MAGVKRRTALGVGAAGVAALNIGKARAQATAEPLSAVVTIAGKTFAFSQEAGQDLGDYIAVTGKFIQRCIRCEVANIPLSVYFRPDRNSERAEVVFELGRVFSPAPENLGAYSVVISRGAQTLARIDVPEHYWFARWRWQSAPRPVVADVDKLTQYGLLPHFTRTPTGPAMAGLNMMPLANGDYVDLAVVSEFTSGNYTNAPKLLMKADAYQALTTGAGNAVVKLTALKNSYSVMRLAGVQAYMPNTGERPDIGLVTEPQAQFIATSDQDALDVLMSQAEAAGTMPWHMRDERQNGPFDFTAYPNATWYGANAGSPYIRQTTTPVTLDSAHQPGLAYMPFVLTDDPYFLEELQFQATWNWGALPAGYRPSGAQAGIIAWNLRTLAQAARVTPIAVPQWLLPNRYWVQKLTETRQWFEANYVFNASPERQIFRAAGSLDNGRREALAPEGTWIDPWQDEFLVATIGWVVFMGFADWRPAFAWSIGGTIARTSQHMGWVRAHATPYRIILRASKTAPVATSWAQAWELTKSIAKKTYTDANTWVDDDMTYLTYTRGALVYASKLGMAEANEPLAWATAQLKARKWNVATKWRLGPAI